MFVCSLACKSVRRAGSGDKLGAVECICWLVCVLMGLLVWAGWVGGWRNLLVSIVPVTSGLL